jgi:hypothetical protein
VLPGAPVTALLKITVKNVWSCYLVLLLLVQQALLPVHTNSWFSCFFQPADYNSKAFFIQTPAVDGINNAGKVCFKQGARLESRHV